MIDRASIIAWNEQAPWTEPAMVEQDLIICKALVCIFSYEFLALAFSVFLLPKYVPFLEEIILKKEEE